MVLKSEIEKAIQLQQVSFAMKQDGLERSLVADLKINQSHIVIITGIRRCGKSTLISQISKRLQKPFVFVNFEDPRIFGFELGDFTKLDELLGDSFEHYFFDEVQSVDKWEIFIRNLHDREKKIFITGSNASLLSKELGTRLTGRHIQIELFPFSYNEYCSFKKYKKSASTFTNYLNDGGFPEYLKSQQKEHLQQLFKDIIYRDIIVRHGIRNDKTLVDIALFLLSNTGKEYSLNSIKNIFKVGSANSIADYIKWFEDSYLLFSLPCFSWSLKSTAVLPKKIYAIDTGFSLANTLSFTEDTGRLLENAVYIELRKKYHNLYYFKQGGECDFIVKEGIKVTNAIQVCLEVHTDNMDRELNGIIAALEFFNLEKGIIVTLNQEDLLIKDNKTIQLIPAWKWFESN